MLESRCEHLTVRSQCVKPRMSERVKEHFAGLPFKLKVSMKNQETSVIRNPYPEQLA